MLNGTSMNRTFDIELNKAIYNSIFFNRSPGNPITSWVFGIEVIKNEILIILYL